MGFPKRVLLIACSKRAWLLQRRLCEKIKEAHPETELICKVKCKELEQLSEKVSLTECVGEWFSKTDAIVFLCAAGIAVRSIAPYLVHKAKDPAVVVMDEAGDFCISLLSGHWGGANALAEELADMTGAAAVVTTATDRARKFAVDVFAAQNNLSLTDWKLAKEISAAILSGEKIPVITTLLPEEGQRWPGELIPMTEKELQELTLTDAAEKPMCIYIGERLPGQLSFARVLQLVPRSITLGIGCRRGCAESEIREAVTQCLEEQGLDLRSVDRVASIDLKKEEAGLLAFCKENQLPFFTFSAEELLQVQGSKADSAFVRQVTGISNVCERSALAASQGRLLTEKRIYGRVTVALAEKRRSLRI